MNSAWIKRLRNIHTWLGVFFSPLLLLFIAAGWWQTFATEDETKEKTGFNGWMSKFSDVHTSDYFAHGGHAQASKPCQIFVGGMAGMMIVTILLRLALAWQAA